MSAPSILADLFRAVEERMRRRLIFASLHPYRIVRQSGARVSLQAVNEREVLLPQLVEVDKAHGAQGLSELCGGGGIVLVGFQGGSPGAPFVASYLDARPLEVELDAVNDVRIGPGATVVHLAGGTQALALGSPVSTLASALSAFATTASTATTAAQIATAAATLQSALLAISTYSTTKVRGA
jgi:hypothetical protein